MNGTVVDQAAASAATASSSEFDSLLQAPSTPRAMEQQASPADAAAAGAPPVIEADVDGKRVRIVAQEEIVLECGNASITLRRNGRIVIKGTYVETSSEGTNRIKGGQVRIN